MQIDLHGLTTDEAAAQFATDGPNELPRAGRRRLPRILRDVLTEPMFALLLGSGSDLSGVGRYIGGSAPARFSLRFR